MANVSVTASQVGLTSGPYTDGIAGEAITAGQVVYQKQSDGRWYMAQSDGGNNATGQEQQGQYGLGIAVNTASGTGQAVRVALAGADVDLGAGAAVAADRILTVSATFGTLADVADIVASGNWRPVACIGKGSNRVRVIGVAAEASIP